MVRYHSFSVENICLVPLYSILISPAFQVDINLDFPYNSSIKSPGEDTQRIKEMNNQQLIDKVKSLIKTDPYPYNETNIEDWIAEGDTDDMTAEEIAAEWDEVNSQDKE